jgi:septal ring factor EnvC (AmiA/AmiB activator)
MGRLADFFREQSISLAGQQKAKMLSLDREFEEIKAERDALKAQNLNLQAEVNPLKRQIERMQDEVERTEADLAARNERLDEKAETLLEAIAQRFNVPRDGGASIINGTSAEARYHLGILRERRLIRYVSANYTNDGRYEATQDGLAYLKKIGRL